MKLTLGQIADVRRAVIEAIEHRARSWDAQRAIEIALGTTFTGIDEACETFAVNVGFEGDGSVFTLSDADIQDFFSLCEEEE
jgi:hypothetical protein